MSGPFQETDEIIGIIFGSYIGRELTNQILIFHTSLVSFQ